MAVPQLSLSWLEHIELSPKDGLGTEKGIANTLRKQLLAALRAQDYEPADLERCVYIVRMSGDFIVSYPWQNSPVLYIGRGSAFGRLAAHMKRWLHEVEGFGKDVRIQIRVCRPRRKNSADLFKYVEADLIARFADKFGTIPFFNSRREWKYEECADYTDTDERQLRAAIGIGSGKRPRWAIAPTPANRNYDVYYRGHVE
jgi:hypothetical protein